MANPRSNEEAVRQVRRLLTTPRVAKAERYLNAETEQRMLRRAEFAADQIWCRFQVGIWRWREKHVLWLFHHVLKEKAETTRKDYKLAVARVLRATDKERITGVLERV